MLPFPNQPQWVPVYRERFAGARGDLPSWIVQKQETKHCWREQFPLDLCRAMTCHRAQGQTLRNCSVAVDLGLANPDRQLPADISSILYVAVTRATQLQDLLVDYIAPSLWERIGHSDDTQDVEASLVTSARDFAANKGMLREVILELDFKPDYGSCVQERRQLESGELQPTRKEPVSVVVTESDLMAETENGRFSMMACAVRKERHVGIDQGRRNFAIVAVDKEMGEMPVVVAAEKYDLNLGERVTAAQVLMSLRANTHLWSWMQQTDDRPLPDVDRVIVHIEQMSVRNRHWKQFGIELGQLLQQSVVDEGKCVVKLSQPHLFRAGGVVECLGEQIVQELDLAVIGPPARRKRVPAQASICQGERTCTKRTRITYDDVEPSDVTSESDADAAASEDVDYRRKKLMSASIFRYMMEADRAKEEDMKVMVSAGVREMWQCMIVQDPKVKLDDLGDALLHALNDILCGSSKYRQLVPSSVSLHNNRTVVVSVCRDHTYFAVIHCTWNTFEVEDLGYELTGLTSAYFNSQQTERDIRQTLLTHLDTALTDPSGAGVYRPVEVIKMVVKQLKAFMDFKRKHAGSLTNSTVRALQGICNDAAGSNSTLHQETDKVTGAKYIRTQRETGHKFQVMSSTGKLTNAMLACMNWMHESAADFVERRTAFMDEKTKLAFFLRLQTLAKSSENQMEHLILSERMRTKLASEEFSAADSSFKSMLAYLILVGININEQRVKAVAANYRAAGARKPTKRRHPEGAESMDVDGEPVPGTSSGITG